MSLGLKLFASLVINVRWYEVGALLVLMALVMNSFLRKSSNLRWVTLAYSLVYLGFMKRKGADLF